MSKSDKSPDTRRRDQVTGGLLLIVIGVFLYLVQRDVVEVRSVWLYWPVALILVGVIKLVSPGQGRDLPSGTFETLAGLWFLACNFHWYGFTYRETWPLIFVAIGLSQVFQSLRRARKPADAEKEESHA